MNLLRVVHGTLACVHAGDQMSQRPFFIYAPVQTDRTADSLWNGSRSTGACSDPATGDAGRIDTFTITQYAGPCPSMGTASSVAGDIAELVRFGCPMILDQYAIWLGGRHR